VSHRAAVYTVRVHPRRDPDHPRLLGDIDDTGTALMDLLADYLPKLDITDDARKLRYLRDKVVGSELLAMFEDGRGGVDARIRNRDGEEKYHQLWDDSQAVECGCLFRLVPNQRQGWLAVHVPDRRGIKTLLGQHIQKLFRADYHDLLVEIVPYVVESALQQAVDQDLIRTVTLVRRVQPSDRAVAGIDQWVSDGTYGKIKVTIGASLGRRAEHLLTDPLRRFLQGDSEGEREEARQAIVQFMGMEFDEAKVEIPQGDTTRTFNIEHLDTGHPLTEDMRLGRNGPPSEDEIFAGLRAALQNVTS
jgi:hypothetical protein